MIETPLQYDSFAGMWDVRTCASAATDRWYRTHWYIVICQFWDWRVYDWHAGMNYIWVSTMIVSVTIWQIWHQMCPQWPLSAQVQAHSMRTHCWVDLLPYSIWGLAYQSLTVYCTLRMSNIGTQNYRLFVEWEYDWYHKYLIINKIVYYCNNSTISPRIVPVWW